MLDMPPDVPVLLNCNDALLSQAAAFVADGVGRTGVKAVPLSVGGPLPPCQGVIIGLTWFDTAFLKQLPSGNLRVAVLLVRAGGNGKAELAEITRTLQESGARVENTLLLVPEGRLSLKAFGRGTLSESSLVRAAGFGERSANAFAGVKASRTSEKDRIAGYKKS